MNGPGKYDPEATDVMNRTQGQLVILMVVSGNRGSGFSVQTDNPDLLATVPGVLEQMAREIRGESGT